MKAIKKEKKVQKEKTESDSPISKRAEAYVFNEIKKSIMQNPALMGQLAQNEKSLGSGGAEVE